MQFRLRTLLILLATWLSAILGAVASTAVLDYPSPSNLKFAFVWGATIGLVPSLGIASYLVENPQTRIATCIVVLIVTGVLSMVSLYAFAVTTAAV